MAFTQAEYNKIKPYIDQYENVGGHTSAVGDLVMKIIERDTGVPQEKIEEMFRGETDLLPEPSDGGWFESVGDFFTEDVPEFFTETDAGRVIAGVATGGASELFQDDPFGDYDLLAGPLGATSEILGGGDTPILGDNSVLGGGDITEGIGDLGEVNMSAEQRTVLRKWAEILDTQNRLLNKQITETDATREILKKFLPQTDEEIDAIKRLMKGETDLANLSQSEIEKIFKAGKGTLEGQMINKLSNLGPTSGETQLSSAIANQGAGAIERDLARRLNQMGPSATEGTLSSALQNLGRGRLESGMLSRLEGMGPSALEGRLESQLYGQGAGILESGLASQIRSLSPTQLESLMQSTLSGMTQGELEQKMVSDFSQMGPSELEGEGRLIGLMQAERLRKALRGDAAISVGMEQRKADEFRTFKEKMAASGNPVLGDTPEEAVGFSTPAVQALRGFRQRWSLLEDEARRAEMTQGTQNLMSELGMLSNIEAQRRSQLLQGTGIEADIEAQRRAQILQGADISSQAQARRIAAYIQGVDVESQAESRRMANLIQGTGVLSEAEARRMGLYLQGADIESQAEARRMDALIRGTDVISDAEAQRMNLYLQGADLESLAESRRLANQISGTSVLGNLANQRTDQLLRGAGLESDIQNRRFNQYNQYATGIPERQISLIANTGTYGYPEAQSGFNSLSKGYANLQQPYIASNKLSTELAMQEGANRAGARSDLFGLGGLLGYGLLTM